LRLPTWTADTFATHALTLARHPSETDERMMVRLLAYALNATTRWSSAGACPPKMKAT
jgi:uncharacterized protein YaeQ